METEEIFEKYRKRLVAIGLLKALIIGAVIGFFATGIAALVVWMAGCNLSVSLWATLGTGAVVIAVSTPVIYLLKFKPDAKTVAKSLDACGLEERAVTLYECRENSFMASLQRTDAREKIKGVSAKRLRFSIAVPVIALLLTSFVFAAVCTTVSALAATDLLGKGEEEIDHEQEDDNTSQEDPIEEFTVNYKVIDAETGHIEGETSQKVKKGGMTKPVVAIPEEGYVFYAWVDENMRPFGAQTPERNDLNVRADMDIYAFFVEASQEKEPSSGFDEKPPQDDKEPDQSGNAQHGAHGNTNNDPSVGNMGGTGGSQSGNGEAGPDDWGTENAPNRENNNVIDGSQDYKEAFDREQEEKDLNENAEMPDDMKDLLKDYFEILDP